GGARGGAERREHPGAHHRSQPDHHCVSEAEPTRQSRVARASFVIVHVCYCGLPSGTASASSVVSVLGPRLRRRCTVSGGTNARYSTNMARVKNPAAMLIMMKVCMTTPAAR